MSNRFLAIALALSAVPSHARSEPRQVEVVPPACVTTRVAHVYRSPEKGEPSTDVPGTFEVSGAGSGGIRYANGVGHLTAYFRIPALERSKPGDVVTYCLISRMVNCPPGDNRGKNYVVKNHRTGETWKENDHEHVCGGA